MKTIKTLEDLISYGFNENALENSKYLYIWPATKIDNVDSHLYKFDKEKKTLERVPGFISVIIEVEDAKDVKIDPDYLKQYL